MGLKQCVLCTFFYAIPGPDTPAGKHSNYCKGLERVKGIEPSS